MSKAYPPAPRCAARETKGDMTLVCTLARGHDDRRSSRGTRWGCDHVFGLPGAERDALEAVREVRQGLRAALGSLLGE